MYITKMPCVFNTLQRSDYESERHLMPMPQHCKVLIYDLSSHQGFETFNSSDIILEFNVTTLSEVLTIQRNCKYDEQIFCLQ